MTEDWNNAANLAFPSKAENIFKKKLFKINIFRVFYSYCIFDQINAAFVSV